MKSIKKQFKVLQEKNKGHSAYISLAGAINGLGYTRGTVSRNFTDLIPKDDYVTSERDALIDNLMDRTNSIEEYSLKVMKAPRKSAKKKVVEVHKEELVEPLRKNIKNNYYGEKD